MGIFTFGSQRKGGVRAWLVSLLLLNVPLAWAQAPSWQTAVAAGGSTAIVTASATDGADNVYLVGRFVGTAHFGTISLASAGAGDVFIAKWNRPAAAFSWAERVGGRGDDYANAVAVKGARVYVAGSFAGTADFGPATLASSGADDGFVMRLTDAGATSRISWVQPVTGPGNEQVTALAVAGTGVYVGGEFNSPTGQLGTLAIRNASNTANGFTADGFVARLDDADEASSFAWARPLGGTGTDRVNALAAVGSSIYAVGGFSNTVDFGATTLLGGSMTAFYTKLLDTGMSSTISWAVSSGGIVIPNAIAATEEGVYVAGRFIFSGSWGSTTYASTGPGGGYDMFIAKLTDAGATGSFTWALLGSGPASDYASALAVRGRSIYVVGGFRATASFGSLSLTSATNSDDWFVAKVLDAGASAAYAWVQQAGGPAYEQAFTVALGSGGTVYVGGRAGLGASFGSLSVNGLAGDDNASLAVLADPLLATPTGSPASLVGLALYPSPAHGTATVRLPVGSGPATLTLVDALGRVVRVQPAPASPSQLLELQGLAPGVYALRVQVAGGQGVCRLVVE
jgi:hypothetical protein